MSLGLVISFAVSALIELAAPLALAVFLARRLGARWRFWLYGVLVFLVFQALTRVPLLIFVQTRPEFTEAMQNATFAWAFLGFAAFTAGLFEEGGRWLAYRFLVRQADRTWLTATMMGAGHGGLESMLIGVVALATLAGYLAIHLVPPESLASYADQVEQARQAFSSTPPWAPLLGAWERLAALSLHVALSVMVLLSFIRGARWWWYALAAHTLVDFAAVGILRVASKSGGEIGGTVAVEAAMIPVAAASIWFVVKTRRTWAVGAALSGENPIADGDSDDSAESRSATN